MSAEAVIAVARGELGRKEDPPGSNRVPYWDDYDPSFQGQPWCLGFIYSCFKRAGEESAFMGGGKTASCGTLMRWYEAMGQTVPVAQIVPGDILLLNFHGGKDPEHCGLVEEEATYWNSDGDIFDVETFFRQEIFTIEGNTSNGGSQDNGGMVCRKQRYPSQIVAVCRPKYKEEPMPKKDDLTGHWAEDACRKAEDKGVMKGYPDGSWAPDKTLTRAELATVLDRLGLLEK